jgi:hypothetical protein
MSCVTGSPAVTKRASRMCLAGMAAFAMLCACGKTGDSDGDGEVSRDERAERIPEGIRLPLTAGLWQSSVVFSEIKVPGLNKRKKQEIMTRMSQAASKKTCLTAQQASRPPADFFGGGTGGACKYRSFAAQKGNGPNGYAIAMSCAKDGMAIADMNFGGNIGARQYGFDVSTGLRLPMIGKVELTGKSQGSYLGPCAAG